MATPSAVGLGVLAGADAEVEVAYGFVVQALPAASAASVERAEHNGQGLVC